MIFETGTRIIGFINPNKNNDNDRDAFGVDEEEERRRKGSGLCNSWNLMGGLRRGPLSYFDSNTFGSTPREFALNAHYGRNGKYSKRRRSNVAVIIVRIVFISAFLFYCLLLNHSFQTNPNSITNCFQLFSLFTTLQTTFAQCVAF